MPKKLAAKYITDNGYSDFGVYSFHCISEADYFTEISF